MDELTRDRTVEALAHELGQALGPRSRWVFLARKSGSGEEAVFSSMSPAELRRFVAAWLKRQR